MRRSGAIIIVCVTLLAGCGGGGESAERDAPADGDSTGGSVRIVSQNLLHGLDCPPDSGRCAAADRVRLFARQLEDSDCPEIVALQEVNGDLVAALRESLADTCDDAYDIVWDDDRGADREAVLTTLTVVASRRIDLAGALRTALWVRTASSVGLVDLATTHLAGSIDDRPCDERTCPPPCRPDYSVGTCQAAQVAESLNQMRSPESVTLLAGDLNARPGHETIDLISGLGFTDTHLAGGNPECDAESGAQCTSGRDDTSLDALRGASDALNRQSERIDYVFYFEGSRDCDIEAPTGLFHPEPEPDGPSGLAYVSDHTGVQAALHCPVGPADRTAADRALASTTSSVVASTTSHAVGGETTAAGAITTAFEAVFGGDVTDLDEKLASIEDGEAMRKDFVARYEGLGDIVYRTRVEVDAIRRVDARHAAVIYSILVDGVVVLDRLDGSAVRVGDRWLVTRRTYCDVSTQGQTEIPESCS